jgi:hypothetical protein
MANERLMWLDQGKLVAATTERVHGPGGFQMAPSPYDIPEALRSYTDDEGRRVLEISYIGPDEPYRLEDLGVVKVKAGKNSGRIYAFYYAEPDEEVQSIVESFHQAVVQLMGKPSVRSENYKLVDAALEHDAAAVLSEDDDEAAAVEVDHLEHVAGGYSRCAQY